MPEQLVSASAFSIVPESAPDSFWSLRLPGKGPIFRFGPPIFEVDGRTVSLGFGGRLEPGPERTLRNGCQERSFRGRPLADPGLELEAVFRWGKSPFIRFKYILRGAAGRKLTKTASKDALTLFRLGPVPAEKAVEVRLAEFSRVVHCFVPAERPLGPRHFEDGYRAIGPILALEGGDSALLLAYEHGSQVPDAFLEFALEPGGSVALKAVKGNYWNGQELDGERPFETVWMQAGAVAGGREELARAYRGFVLREMCENLESRKPLVFYNTWNYQERDKWNRGGTFLQNLRQDYILRDIDLAHRVGVDTYVVDTGWYEKTGDWRVSRSRFPDGMKAVRERLEGYGMRLGLWFNPCVAALTSEMHGNHRDCLQTRGGKPHDPSEVWETEKSQAICLVSRYSRAFADELVRLYRELGVSHFKWDAISQYGCDDPGHWHGGPGNTAEERGDCYAFLQVREMAGVVDRVCAACPTAVVDFDITEAGRTVGLAFLSAAKFFLQNNGPYFHTYDIPGDLGKQQWNIFINPGPTRAWMCRYPYDYDRWIPSVLTMTHYLADDPRDSQLINIASTVLGHNGVWGDLARVSDEGLALWNGALAAYKRVRDDINNAFPVRDGSIGGSPEVHEKVSEETGRGVVCMFATEPGSYEYLTANRVADALWTSEGVAVERAGNGRVRVKATFTKPSARIVFFGK